MAYLTELADWIGNALEQIVGFMMNLSLGLFLFLAVLFLGGLIIVLVIRMRDVTKGVNT